MNSKEIANKLSDMIKLDIDAVQAYKQALDNIEEQDIHSEISQFCNDHKRHIRDLTQCIEDLNETPPSLTPDLKGFFIEGFTALRSLTGTEGALKAMQGNEELTNKKYAEALSWKVPQSIKNILQKNYEDEKRHLTYITKVLANENWKERI